MAKDTLADLRRQHSVALADRCFATGPAGRRKFALLLAGVAQRDEAAMRAGMDRWAALWEAENKRKAERPAIQPPDTLAGATYDVIERALPS